ncbi:MAG: putative lipoprotein [Rickettsiaceae bacterium]|jgi:hypothetical protein|nr:putative lipoprotein [Rickettsiaceae bacterium]
MKIKKLIPLFAALLITQGCATVFSGSDQAINVKVIEANDHDILEGVSCVVTDGYGEMHVVQSNPGVVKVSRSSGSVQVNCKKPGYKQLNTAVGDSFNKTTLVNIIFWPGFLVDAVSGAYKKFPTHYVVSMERIKD